MKRLLFLLLPIVLLASCGARYDNSIHGTIITPSGWATAYDSTGEAVGTRQVYDTSYLVSPTWSQAWAWSGQRNNHVWFWLGIIILVIAVSIFVYEGNRGNVGAGGVVGIMVAILVCGAMIGGSVEWERWNMDQEIGKPTYDKLMQHPGNLGPFWDTIQIK
jgi:hypothetical protein